tara:strand:+ start:1674 stop:2354 length:681 start_codon:yes stop_codon:yes gene_type:complete
MREVVIDIETTGLDFKEGHKIIEIACTELENLIPTGKKLQIYINPERSVGKSIEIHNIKDEFLAEKKIFKEEIPNFIKFIKNDPLIVHNGIYFDIPFLNHELKANNLNIIKNEIIDTLIISRKKFPGAPANLDALCRRFDIDLSIRKKHGALIDTQLLAKVYLELKGGQQPNLNLNSTKDEKPVTKLKNIEKQLLDKREFNLSDEEKNLHKEFIKKIKQPIWNKLN